jgi:hypothetical protein
MTLLRSILVGSIAVIAVACSDTTAPSSITGTWNLKSIDGRLVDTPPLDSASVWIRTHEQLVLNVGGSYVDQIQTEAVDASTGGLVASTHASLVGQWTYSASALSLTGDRDQSGTIARDTLRIGTMVYTR